MNWLFLLFSTIFYLINDTESDRLTAQQNKILKANCGRYVPGFTSLNSHRTRPSSENFKVLYGKKVELGVAPWAISIAMKKKKKSEDQPEQYLQHGTGTLVSPWHIVSAAHLVGVSSDPLPNCETGDMKNAHFMNNFNDFVAFINVTCATPEACESVDKRERFEPIQVKAVYIRHGYVGDGCIDRESFNDLAVFELEKPVEFSRNVFPVCLPITSDPPRRGETGYRLFGFGRDVADKEMETGILKELDSFVTDCSDEIAYDGIFCTSSKTSGLSCDGDSGSGVVRTSRTRNVQELAGVLSAGMPCPELYEKHLGERRRHRELTKETDLLVDVSSHLDFFCKCCGLCTLNY